MDHQMENRRIKRTKTYHPAKVLVQDESVHHCTVHNLTGLGLCIELTFEADQLPDTFDFSFDNFQTVHVCKTIGARTRLRESPSKSHRKSPLQAGGQSSEL